MNKFLRPRLLWLLWAWCLASFVAVAVYPPGTFVTRSGGLGLLTILCGVLPVLVWRQSIARRIIVVVFGLIALFLMLPGRAPQDTVRLQTAYADHLQSYLNVPYFWGGESIKGIDCSGLIRRGLVDSLFLTGLRTFNPRLVRESISLWWHDSSAEALGKEYRGRTVHLFDTPSINGLDPAKVWPGDLAVTQNGVHIMAYLGQNRWIEADPSVGRVIIVSVPAQENVWFDSPMKIMRWRMLENQGE